MFLPIDNDDSSASDDLLLGEAKVVVYCSSLFICPSLFAWVLDNTLYGVGLACGIKSEKIIVRDLSFIVSQEGARFFARCVCSKTPPQM